MTDFRIHRETLQNSPHKFLARRDITPPSVRSPFYFSGFDDRNPANASGKRQALTRCRTVASPQPQPAALGTVIQTKDFNGPNRRIK
ncbi:putative cytochrome [Anopheles sinensis]|uniref:Putative cytochrome n=1 Tax=Anopheles sinensis TaxID=74873 RepID=A0A084VVY6_ANOSI|nr:putative cytochrome [Anopheles sinensis]